MNDESRIILIDDYRIGKIEDIAYNIKTKFTNWNDFVNETIGMYLNWWTNPTRSQKQFLALIPHMTDEMIKNIGTLMDKDEFNFITKDLEQKRKNIMNLDYFPDEPGSKRYEIDAIRFDDIKQIIKEDKVKEKITSVGQFCDYALDYFITLWTKPEKAIEKIYSIWPYMPISVKNQWKSSPEFKNSFIQFDKDAEEYNNKNDISVKPDNDNEIKNDNKIDNSVKNLKEKIKDEKTYESYVRFCEQHEEVRDKIQEISIPKKPTKIGLPHDDHPLIYSFYSRFFPIKIAISVLAQLMVEKNEKTVDYLEFRGKAYDVAVYISDKIKQYEDDDDHKKKRNEKKSTGLPYPITGSDTSKISASKDRFQEHFIGMKKEAWIKRQEQSDDSKKEKGIAYFDGALNAMELVYVESTKNKKLPKWSDDLKKFEFEEDGKHDLKIGLTKKGLELFLFKNEIYNKNSQAYQDKIFSPKESDFIFKNIVNKFKLEKELVEKALETIIKNTKISSDKKTRTKQPKDSKAKHGAYLDDELKTVILSWMQKNKESEEKYKNIFNVKEVGNTKSLETIRSAIMGRLVEINKINWEIEEKTSNTLYSLPEKNS